MSNDGPVTLSPNLGWIELEGIALGQRVLKAATEERLCRTHSPRVQRLGREYLEDRIVELAVSRKVRVTA